MGAVAGVALGVAFVAQPAAGAAAPAVDAAPAVVAAPAVSAAPTSGLTNGATVQLSASGLTPGTVYFVGECSAVSTFDYACNSATSYQVVANSAGTISAPIVVHSAFTGTTGGGVSHAIDCKVRSCVVAAYSASFEGGAVPISFR
jgi:hypothetical protein